MCCVMDQKKSKKSHFSLVELMVCVAVLAIAASITIPRYMTHVFQERQAECAATLRAIYEAQKKYFREHGRYTANLSELDWHPPQKPIYLYGFRDAYPGGASTTQDPTRLCPQENSACYQTDMMLNADHAPLDTTDLPETSFDGRGSYRIGCVGNIDSDATLDRLSIDQAGQLAHISNDLD